MSESKVVVITGGSAGIGAALGAQLGKKGHRVVLAARRADALAGTAAKIEGGAVTVVADVTKRADVERIKTEALRAHGRVDVWVNNAGRGITKSVLTITDEDLDHMIDVNLKSALYGMQAIVPHFQERGSGHVINVSTMLSRVPLASFRAAYSASKAALNVLTTNLRMDLAATHPNVHVTLFLPGLVATEFFANALGGTPPLPGGVPMQSADEVAAVIAGVIDAPVAEAYSSPVLAATARKYLSS